MRYLITLHERKTELSVILYLTWVTSKSAVKTISLLIVAMFLFVQISSASHVHPHGHVHTHHHVHEIEQKDEQSPEPLRCAVCIQSHYNEFDFDADLQPPATSLNFVIQNTIDDGYRYPAEWSFTLVRDDLDALEPPNLRLSAPRAPPV